MALITVPTADSTQTTDMCETCSSVTSTTANPDDEKSTEGVSLRNTPTPTIHDVLSPDYQQPEGYHWYFLRISYNRAQAFYNALKDRQDGYLLWMPCQKKITYNDGKKHESLEPIFKTNIFIYSTYQQAYQLTRRGEHGYPYVDFAYDHTSKTQYGRDNVITIPFAQMVNFAKAEQVHHPWAHIVPEEKIHFRPEGMVRVTAGAFEGVIGRVARVFGQTRVVITIQNVLHYSTAYVSTKNMVPIDSEIERDNADQAAHSPAKNLAQSLKRQARKSPRY